MRLKLKSRVGFRKPSSFDPRLASGALAVAKEETRDRFIGDRRPLIGRERRIGCPRLRRMVLEGSDTVQITIRDAKHCSYLYEVPPSRETKQVLAFPDAGLNIWTMKFGMSLLRMNLKVGFRSIASKRVPPSNLSLNQIPARLG